MPVSSAVPVSSAAAAVFEHLHRQGASFFHDLSAACHLSNDALRAALGELVSAGLIASDGFAGLRALIDPSRGGVPGRGRRVDAAGRWFALPGAEGELPRDEVVEAVAWILLRRYGVVFRRVLGRETNGLPWRDLARVYRRLEARGEIRGGRFVSGMSGEQFALPDAVERLREVRRAGSDDTLIAISAADPLNLTGMVLTGDRIRAVAGTRIVFRNGVPVMAMEADLLRSLAQLDPDVASEAAALAAGRRVPVAQGYVGALRRP